MDDFRGLAHSALTQLLEGPASDLDSIAQTYLHPDCVFDVAYPINRLWGRESVISDFFGPLREALSHARRRDELFIGGPNRRQEGGTWVSAVTHYVGNFHRPLFGIRPSGHLAFLRSGEFYRIDNGKITKACIILDLPDLMRQAQRFPIPRMLGTEMLFPGPATHDGVLPSSEGGEATLDLVEAMLADLHLFDPKTNDSAGQTGPDGYWHDDMLWYGPAGIGSNYRWEGFVDDHRRSFLEAFPDRKGGNHYCRIGDGDFAAVSGWPSMTMTHRGDYLGVPASGKSLTLRVMDFYRCAGDKIMENWVLLDYLDLFNQLGVDLIAKSNAMDTT
ncbi:MAG: ester cyclase [Pseudomonadota bacterium]